MIPGEPSRTALAAATHRAIHHALEGGRVFADPLAERILGKSPDELRAEAEIAERAPMRFFVCARARLAEERIAAAVARGLRQVVVLGAGLDTFAYRHPHGSALAVFEVDHPATQAWKRARLAAADIAVPPRLRYVPVDFETDSSAEALASAGLDAGAPSFFLWLGVVPYLTEAAIFATLGWIARLPGGAEVVFDYGDPPETLPEATRAWLQARAAQVAALGERWISFFEADALIPRVRALGFDEVTDMPSAAIAARFGLATIGGTRGGHVLHARANGGVPT